MNIQQTDPALNLLSQRDELLKELEKAHKIIRNALGLMNSGMKFEWGNRNALDDCEGEGITRANEREALIKRVKGGAA